MLRGGAFLEGVLRVERSAFMSSPRLVRAVHDVLTRLDDDAFRRILPDLRRAFAVFIPAELDAIGERVSSTLLDEGGPDPDAPLDPEEAAAARQIDATVRARLVLWW